MRRRLPALVATGAALAISLTGCFGAEKSGGTAEGGNGGSGSEQKPMTPVQVVAASADKTKAAQSFKALFSARVKTKHSSIVTKGKMSYQTSPMAYDQNISEMTMDGRKLPGGLRMMLVDNTVYMKMAMLSQMAGSKPWIKMSLDEISKKSGVNMQDIMGQVEQNNPVTNTKLLTSSKDVEQVGKENLDGVQTTHYKGTYNVKDGLANLSGKEREAVQKSMLAGTGKMRFELWVDDQQIPHKLVLRGTGKARDVGTGKMVTTMRFSDFGEPVNIAAPPAGQVTDFKELQRRMGRN